MVKWSLVIGVLGAVVLIFALGRDDLYNANKEYELNSVQRSFSNQCFGFLKQTLPWPDYLQRYAYVCACISHSIAERGSDPNDKQVYRFALNFLKIMRARETGRLSEEESYYMMIDTIDRLGYQGPDLKPVVQAMMDSGDCALISPRDRQKRAARQQRYIDRLSRECEKLSIFERRKRSKGYKKLHYDPDTCVVTDLKTGQVSAARN